MAFNPVVSTWQWCRTRHWWQLGLYLTLIATPVWLYLMANSPAIHDHTQLDDYSWNVTVVYAEIIGPAWVVLFAIHIVLGFQREKADIAARARFFAEPSADSPASPAADNAPAPDTRPCKRCGAPVGAHTARCPHCGKDLTGAADYKSLRR
jgi:hypothetical protein